MSLAILSEPMMAADPNLSAEMWISLHSLLSSHAAMHSVAQPQATWSIESHSSNAITIHNFNGGLVWTAPNGFGIGTWRLIVANEATQHGTYSFTEEGLLHFAEEYLVLELEAAVELRLQQLQATERRAR